MGQDSFHRADMEITQVAAGRARANQHTPKIKLHNVTAAQNLTGIVEYQCQRTGRYGPGHKQDCQASYDHLEGQNQKPSNFLKPPTEQVTNVKL